MAKTIKFKAIFIYCKKITEKGKGYLHRKDGKWHAHCFECYNQKKNEN